MEFEDENLSHCLSKDLTLGTFSNVLERLRIDADYASTVQRQNEDHVSHRLYQISIPPQYVTFDQNRNISSPRFFRGILCICRGVRASLKNVIRISELSCLSVLL